MRYRISILLDIDESDRSAAMDRRRSGRGIGIGGYQDFIARAYSKNSKIQFLGGGSGIQARNSVAVALHIFRRSAVDIRPARFDICCQTTFQQLCPRAGGDPAGTQRFADFSELKFADIGRAETDHSLFHLIHPL